MTLRRPNTLERRGLVPSIVVEPCQKVGKGACRPGPYPQKELNCETAALTGDMCDSEEFQFEE